MFIIETCFVAGSTSPLTKGNEEEREFYLSLRISSLGVPLVYGADRGGRKESSAPIPTCIGPAYSANGYMVTGTDAL